MYQAAIYNHFKILGFECDQCSTHVLSKLTPSKKKSALEI